MLDRGKVGGTLFVQSVFGLLDGIGGHSEDVQMMRRTADRLFGKAYQWSVLGAGAHQLRIGALAAAMGGHVRVGLEDSLWAGPGELARTSAEQVAKMRLISMASALTRRRRTRRGRCLASRVAIT